MGIRKKIQGLLLIFLISIIGVVFVTQEQVFTQSSMPTMPVYYSGKVVFEDPTVKQLLLDNNALLHVFACVKTCESRGWISDKVLVKEDDTYFSLVVATPRELKGGLVTFYVTAGSASIIADEIDVYNGTLVLKRGIWVFDVRNDFDLHFKDIPLIPTPTPIPTPTSTPKLLSTPTPTPSLPIVGDPIVKRTVQIIPYIGLIVLLLGVMFLAYSLKRRAAKE